jgi:hypothetical protein
MANSQWIGRVDLPLTFSREIDMTYAILRILSADVVLQSDVIGNYNNRLSVTAHIDQNTRPLPPGTALLDSDGNPLLDDAGNPMHS